MSAYDPSRTLGLDGLSVKSVTSRVSKCLIRSILNEGAATAAGKLGEALDLCLR
jgi:hypothetical protein